MCCPWTLSQSLNKTIKTIFGHYISLLICMRHLRVTHTTDKETQYYYFATVVVFLFVMRLTLLAILGLGGDFSGESKQEVKEADFVYASFNLLIKSPAPIPIRQAIGLALMRMSKVLRRQPTHPVVYRLKVSPSFPLAVAVSCSYSGFQLMAHPYLSAAICFAFWQLRFLLCLLLKFLFQFWFKTSKYVLCLWSENPKEHYLFIFYWPRILSNDPGKIRRREAISLVVLQNAFLTQHVFIYKQRKHKPTKRQFTKYNVFSLINSIFKGCFFLLKDFDQL